jgi:ATP-dependent DNA helicase RecG
VGRGSARSWCFLLGAGATPDSEERLRALERTSDGFELAEVDLELRGEGTILGTRQKGATDLKLASLRRDRELVALAREVAFDLVDRHEDLRDLPELAEEISFTVDEEDSAFLFKN